MGENQKDNDLFFVCSLIEHIARKTKNTKNMQKPWKKYYRHGLFLKQTIIIAVCIMKIQDIYMSVIQKIK